MDQINSVPEITLEYLELVKEEDLSPPLSYTDFNPLVLCFAGYVEEVRLIDNIIIDKGSK
jgi:pantothenate synthetase